MTGPAREELRSLVCDALCQFAVVSDQDEDKTWQDYADAVLDALGLEQAGNFRGEPVYRIHNPEGTQR